MPQAPISSGRLIAEQIIESQRGVQANGLNESNVGVSSGARGPGPLAAPVVDKKSGDDGYIPMNWIEDGGKKTWHMLQCIKEDPILRQSLYPAQGEESTSLSATKCHQQIAQELLSKDTRYARLWPRLKVKYGLAVKARLHKLYEVYIHKRAILNNSGAGLSDADRAKFPEVNNLQELVRALFVWYDAMDEFCHERAVVGLDSLVNSDDSPDLTVLSVRRVGATGGGDAAGGKHRVAGDIDGDQVVDGVHGGDAEAQKEASACAQGANEDAKDANVARVRGSRGGQVDLSPIGQAIRDGDLLRESKREKRSEALERSRELDRVAKNRRVEVAFEYKLKRDAMRRDVASAKLAAEVKMKQLEVDAIHARVREKELEVEAAKIRWGSLGNPAGPSSDRGSSLPARQPGSEGSSSLSKLLS